MIRSYNEKDLKKVVSEALEQSREKRDKRFNFFISPKLLEFLEQSSNSEGITKSKLIRNLIVEHMRENKVEDTNE
jgi:predicted DNA binding CopG/RHH family protein